MNKDYYFTQEGAQAETESTTVVAKPEKVQGTSKKHDVNYEALYFRHKNSLRDLISECERIQATLEKTATDMAGGHSRVMLSGRAKEVASALEAAIAKAKETMSKQ